MYNPVTTWHKALKLSCINTFCATTMIVFALGCASGKAPKAPIKDDLTVGKTDVYTVIGYMNDLQESGAIDGYRYYENPDEIIAWKRHRKEAGGWVYRLDMTDYLFNGATIAEREIAPFEGN